MPSVPKVRPRSAREIEDLAQTVIQSFQPEALRTLTCFAVEDFFELELKERTGVEPKHDWLGEGLDGYTDFQEMKCVISLSLMEYGECDKTRRRLRATQAHEIGHCYLHVEDARRDQAAGVRFLNDEKSSLRRYRPEDIKIYENPEWQAWRFAAALLMPEACFRRAVEIGWTKRMIKHAFDVNPAFIDVRLRELKIPAQLKNG